MKILLSNRFTNDIVKIVKTKIRSELSARHLPAIILETPDIPVLYSNMYLHFNMKVYILLCFNFSITEWIDTRIIKNVICFMKFSIL